MTARDVGLVRGGRAVLAAVDLDVVAGRVLALVGPNGAGKSSLLGALAGDLPIDRGTITLFDAPLATWSQVETAMRRSVLLQRADIAFPFRVIDVVRMGRAPWAGTDDELLDDAAVEAAMIEADVASIANRPATQLSGGERARVALARVLAQAAPVILLDEPTAALDIHHQEHVMEVIRARADRGQAVMVVVHDLGLAAAHADVIALIDHGSIVAHGDPTEVFEEELLSSVYGRPIEVMTHPRTGRPMVLPRR